MDNNDHYVIADGILTGSSSLRDILARDRLEIYEVVRISDGRPVFAEEHYDRFRNSLASIGKEPVLSGDEFRNQIETVAAANSIEEQNLRIEQYREPDEDTEHINIYPIPSHYPTAEMYAEGVRAGLLRAERDNPQAKIFNKQLRQLADEEILVTGVEEVLLVNRSGEITEGSRSNVFFVRGDVVYAAPQHTVLPGITRLKVLELIRAHDIEYAEMSIRADEIDGFDAAFLTGTSKEVLPISGIGSVKYDIDNAVVRSLMRWYRELVDNCAGNCAETGNCDDAAQ